jgi:hypothetical protein
MPTQPTLKTEAESWAIAIILGIAEVKDAVAWADKKIEESDSPDGVLCEIAMASKAYSQDVVHLLREIPGVCDKQIAVNLVLKLLLDSLQTKRHSPEQVAEYLYDLALSDTIPQSELKECAFSFWDVLDMAKMGYIGESYDEVVQQMKMMLSQHTIQIENQSE